jgi:excisionase family DNA binding protein
MINRTVDNSATSATAPASEPLQRAEGKPLAYGIPQVCTLTGLGRTTIYGAIKSGHLIARRYGRRTVVLEQDLLRFLNNLPAITQTA